MSEFARTKRLIVHRIEVPEGFDEARWIYVAVADVDDHCGVAVTAVVTHGDAEPPYEDYCTLWGLETAEHRRRQGYASELLDLLVQCHPYLFISGATKAGEAFCSAYHARREDWLDVDAANWKFQEVAERFAPVAKRRWSND